MPKGTGNQKRTCIICGKEFFVYPSQNNVTCGKECRKEYARRRQTGRRYSDDSKEKMRTIARGRDMSEVQSAGTAAAKESPKSGRFETNVNAKEWHLVSPEGREFRFRSLACWLRENCREHFGCEPYAREFYNVYSGLRNAKRSMLGGNYRTPTYKGWKVIPTEEDFDKVPPPKICNASREGGTPQQ